MVFKKLKIVHISSEVDPFSKSGGLSNVARSLPKAHKRLGHETIVITPYYSGIINARKFGVKKIISDVKIDTTHKKIYEADYYKSYLMKDLPVYFAGNEKFFGKKKNLYGSKHENLRFLFFSVAALELLKQLDFQPDIIHCHDWHTGLIPYFLNGRFKNDPFWKNTSTVFTIHNLLFQLGHNWWNIPVTQRDKGWISLPATTDPKLENINFAKRAILNADVINTVSETYREEILTKDFGQDLHRILKNREKKVFGIVNGIDYGEYDPLVDPGIVKHYSYKSIEGKKINKEKLQKHFNLKVDHKIPIISMTSRIAEQKGLKLLMNIIKPLMRLNIQIIIMGDGDKSMVGFFKKIAKQHPTKLAITPFKQKRETFIYAGSDIFLLPSRFEPCGINQMIALRYGCIPVVHHIGGLADTIINYNPITNKGNGFNFKKYNSNDLLIATIRALETYKYKKSWDSLVKSGMQEANSWQIPAKKYLELYKAAETFRKKNNKNKK
jgi:starch synthase